MESVADKYLHKKFKKQSNVEPKNQSNDKETKTALPSVPHEDATQAPQADGAGPTLPGDQCSKITEDQPRIDNKECVPNKSTNQNSSSVLTPPYASSNLHRSSISKVEESSDKSKELTKPQSTSCISYVISTNGRVADADTRQLDSQIRSVYFDTKCNVTEPISNTVAQSSSILENVNFKQNYVSSKLVSLEKEDISSSSQSEKDRLHEERQFFLEKPPDRKSETSENSLLPIPDKSSGGKHVCPYCNLACSKPSVLQKHIRAHTNERPYPCVSCGFSFKTRSNLYKHCRSRTHANRVMGNKAQEMNSEAVMLDRDYCEQKSPSNQQNEDTLGQTETSDGEKSAQEFKSKPYKPRFHTAKAFFDSVAKENVSSDNEKIAESPHDIKHTKDLLSHHINELINKNNSIVNSTDPYLLKRKSIDNSPSECNNEIPQRLRENSYILEPRNSDEPLNLTNKNRKRCLSEVTEPAAQRSLIKELLLKNLYADSNMQCPYCRMLFQTVTELELHKLRSCKGFTKSGARYSRSSSVNVASILTQNKNAFDNIPHLQNAVFPLKSPGPFLGKTRLVESDKSKSFSFDDNLPTTFQHSPNDLMKTSSQRYLLSPLTVQYDREKKPPVKLFGGEVKITHTSGETKSFKIDSKEEDKFTSDSNYVDYGGNLSENRVVKSTLQSGGTVLTSKPPYNKQESLRTSPDVIRVYESPSVSSNIDLGTPEKSKFTFSPREIQAERERSYQQQNLLLQSSTTGLSGLPISPFRYTNIMDFSQNAAKLLAPNLKQLNLPTIPGVSFSSKAVFPVSPVATKHEKLYEPTVPSRIEIETEDVVHNYSKDTEGERRNSENMKFAQKQILMQQRMTADPPSVPSHLPLYNPMNLYVNGKVVRYVPGIPGPVAAAEDVTYSSNINRIVPPSPRPQKISVLSPMEVCQQSSPVKKIPFFTDTERSSNSVISDRQNKSPKTETLEVSKNIEQKTLEGETSVPEKKSPNQLLPPSTSETKKFARPNSLALKPSLASMKQHHGLTPTIFNQVLISPDTPRVAKKYNQHMMHGNYFSYLGLKSSTKSVYCTLNKTQPVYVPHFKKLSMYSEWRQQDNKSDKLYVSAYDSRQKHQEFTTAGKASADLIVHSSYKFTVPDPTSARSEEQKSNSVLGGYECNDDYTYVRGRGRGRFVCDQCGIRCKKPSMLKKHLRTHSNDRPYTCSHCNFSFKTKGNLTKHMKSKAHTKNYAASNSSNSSAHQSGTQSSESDTEDSGMDSSDESTRQQEHEAAYGLLSLSQKTSPSLMPYSQGEFISTTSPAPANLNSSDSTNSFMNTEELVHVTKKTFAKNKFLDQQAIPNFSTKHLDELPIASENSNSEQHNFTQYLGKTNTSRPLTYPYTSVLQAESSKSKVTDEDSKVIGRSVENKNELKSIRHFQVIQNYNYELHSPKKIETSTNVIAYTDRKSVMSPVNMISKKVNQELILPKQLPIVKLNDKMILGDISDSTGSDLRKRKISVVENVYKSKIHRNDEVMDLSVRFTTPEKRKSPEFASSKYNGSNDSLQHMGYISPNILHVRNDVMPDAAVFQPLNNVKSWERPKIVDSEYPKSPRLSFPIVDDVHSSGDDNYKGNDYRGRTVYRNHDAISLKHDMTQNSEDVNRVNISYVMQDAAVAPVADGGMGIFKSAEYDNSAMETLADIATKQVKLEKNSVAKNVASEFLKLATKNEFPVNDGLKEGGSFVKTGKDSNELIVKPEENRSCTICSKSFSKPSQLRLHMNIHYLERPFRCDSCSVGFRTKGQLQKHERSGGHHNKLSSSPALSSSEPRPFKCSDCNIAFRIHGHLAKHLRSKMHIMKLECLAKIPFGLYAELERSNSLLTEINTADGDQCLESLKTLAKKVFINDPSKLNRLEGTETEETDDS